MNQNTITYDSKGFIINGERVFLIGGEFHYFRVPADLWEDRLQKMKRTGANLISVYIPWSMHEPEEGNERWSGDYDLDRFLRLCEKYNFYILIKPGPYVCAELDFGGHPDWLIAKVANKEIKLRMLNEGYLKLCRKWYKKVSEKINPYLITNGGKIIAIQIENEYDHLIAYGEETITKQDAIDYFLYLIHVMEEYGVDIPKFANEAAFLRGMGVIETRTYYPNIPWLWMWEFDAFDKKIMEAKKGQPDCPTMILELQAGWFAQIGVPAYNPDVNVIECVSKSVLILGASIMNYYMMAGGTSFPFIGARGDIELGGLGNITSYDFGSSPIREDGEIHKEKFYWIKGFIRFVQEFADIILDSDKESYIRLLSGGEDIAVLQRHGAIPDTVLDKSFENFNTYEKGNSNGRFFCIRNLENEDKTLTLFVSKALTGSEYRFTTIVKAKETRLIPVAFIIPGSDRKINYSTSEVLFSRKYARGTVFVMYGKKGSAGETCIDTNPENIMVVQGNVTIDKNENDSLLKYTHSDISILKINDIYLIIIEEGMIGKVEELPEGLLFHNSYFIKVISEQQGSIELDIQVKENEANIIRIFPMQDNIKLNRAIVNENPTQFQFEYDRKSGMYTVDFNSGLFHNTPRVEWTSGWKYRPDSEEVDPSYDHSAWLRQDRPVSLEEIGFIKHGYYWYRSDFELGGIPDKIFMDYKHNNTDRMFIYINGAVVYKSHNREIRRMDITSALRFGKNTIAILYANEFHNKSHPAEGDIIKYSGMMNPVEIYGNCVNKKPVRISLDSFYVKKGLAGMAEGYTTLEYDDSSWNPAPEARKFVVGRELGHIVWFRRKFKYDIGEKFNAPLKFKTEKADQRLTVYVNGKPVARYDILGPQEEFYIPEPYLNPGEENVLSIILECPAFYEASQSGYRRGYMYNPILESKNITKNVKVKIT